MDWKNYKFQIALLLIILSSVLIVYKSFQQIPYVIAYQAFYHKDYNNSAKWFYRLLRRPGTLEEYIHYYLAESYFQLGSYDLAVAEYEKLSQKFPAGRFDLEIKKQRYFCYRGLYQLKKMSCAEILFIIKLFYNENKIVDALEAVNYLSLRLDITRAQLRETIYYRALCNLFLRNFETAKADLYRMLRWPGYNISSLFYLATLHRTIDEFYPAINYYQKVYRIAPGGSLADDALYWTGFCYENLRNYPAAHKYYLKLAAAYPYSNFADDCWWRVGIYYYRLGHYRTANYYFCSGFARQPGKDISAELAYFAAKSFRKLNNLPQREYYLKATAKYYFSAFYGKRAVEVLGSTENIKPIIVPTKKIKINSANFNFFVKNKLYRDAEKELLYIRQGIKPEQRVSIDPMVATLAFSAQKYNDCIKVMAPHLQKTWSNKEPAPASWWALSFPRGYWEIVLKYSSKYKVDPYFVLAVLREESLFNPEIVSSARAIGLMQIIPETGHNLFTVLHWRNFDRKKLFDPEINIQLGIIYLSRLLKEYKGNIYYTLCAYNAGPQALKKWTRHREQNDDIDEFIERIPFGETRMYVKRVMNTYLTYKMIYESGINPKYFKVN
ncbi:protein containing Lytic transglycosylase-like, catalytic domain [sediment metagenome]|uniref:Protein containing Lytic transglycosylase-like, catalytic domain n=1 Tax=sediment metagenome TaxID=749907 RepID=D9PMB4_9ZZZZ